MSDEIWKSIPGYEGFYEASSLGRVRRCDRSVERKSGKRVVKGRVLKPGTDRYGYKFLTLCKNGVVQNILVHRLVMLAFVGNPPQGHEINHLDCDRQNNRLANLEYTSRLGNVQHARSMRWKKKHADQLCLDLGKH
jgi:NUMOD4 motif/HNH endonuclease